MLYSKVPLYTALKLGLSRVYNKYTLSSIGGQKNKNAENK